MHILVILCDAKCKTYLNVVGISLETVWGFIIQKWQMQCNFFCVLHILNEKVGVYAKYEIIILKIVKDMQ